MAIITQAEVKTRLGITGTSQDNLIDAMILDITDWLPDYLNNPFINPNLYYSASTISFATLTITDTADGFVDAGFVNGMDIWVNCSDSNNGHYEINTADTDELLVVDNGQAFTIEAAGDATPYIYQVQYPQGLKSIVANMIKFQINQTVGGDAKSEKIGDYSVTYKDTAFAGAGASAYPTNIIGSLKPYRKLSW